MRKIAIYLLVSVCLCFQLLAQAPNKFSFQGAARNAAGAAITNKIIGLRLTIHQTIAIGPVVYQEKHTASTTAGGVFNIIVGEGNSKVGNLEDIKWKDNKYFLEVELDPDGETNYTKLGITQLLSVPYALHAAEAGNWKHDDPIIQKGDINKGGDLPIVGGGSRLIWYPKKYAFRAGFVYADEWEDDNIAQGSAAFGSGTKAYGFNSFSAGEATIALGSWSGAFGYLTKATGSASIASGWKSSSTAQASTALGINCVASGNGSLVGGINTVSKAFGSVSFGISNDNQDNPNQGSAPGPTDRIFQIGNGTYTDAEGVNLRNALTLLRNGNLGLGNNVLAPEYILDIGGRARIRYNANGTAGIFFNNSQQAANAFVGMKADQEVGFFIGGTWRFWVNESGQGLLNGALVQTSDRRLKRDFSPLSSSLASLSNLNGHHYYWKSASSDQSLQTGLIAQEVGEIFPELVSTDKDGMMAVNYIGLIPHLIEAVKELKAENEYLKKSASRLSELEASVAELLKAKKDASTPDSSK